jgi:hypothetical protein
MLGNESVTFIEIRIAGAKWSSNISLDWHSVEMFWGSHIHTTRISESNMDRSTPSFRATSSMQNHSSPPSTSVPYAGQRWLVEERDACGVGFIATTTGTASHQLIEQSLTALGCMEHRGGCSADRDSGDGSGVMTAIPHQLFRAWFDQNNLPMPDPEKLGVGMVFFAPRGSGCRRGPRLY